jgi:hypothetical protein
MKARAVDRGQDPLLDRPEVRHFEVGAQKAKGAALPLVLVDPLIGFD